VELPRRPKDDQFTKPGRYRELQLEIQRQARQWDIPILFIYAFDRRTRLGPFLFVDKSLIPAAPRAVASALHAAGLTNVRVVLQQWSPNVRPSKALIGGKRPEVLFVSAMQIHSANAYALIRDAWQLGDQRPLILAGGSKAVFEPWDYFGLSPDGREGADLVVTGEEYVILEVLERILAHKHPSETMRAAFERVRGAKLLEDIPGLVYRPDAPHGPPPYLVNTGVQRLLQDLDELPLPFDALGLFEPPHQRSTLSPAPVPREQLGRHASIMAMIATRGCKFRCPYCPIPGYNQYSFRYRSPQRLADEMAGIAGYAGIKRFFGTDDNIFNDRKTVEEMFTAMARSEVDGRPFRKAITFATEATEIDVFKNQDLLPLARDGGLRSLWFGIEDLTAGLVKKGQSPEKTKTVFKLLLKQGIAPMPMMMHHDGQPLWTWRGLYGLLNQVRFLWRAGAVTCQVTLLTPSVGSKSYEQNFRDGTVLKSVAGKPIENYQYDGNHCVATADPNPFRRQLNMLLSYVSFYNPVNLVRALPRFDALWAERVVMQLYGMVGVAKSIYHVRDWLRRLVTQQIERFSELPPPKFPMVVPSHVSTSLAHYGAAVQLPVLG
jgi:radical SAM superfamily enzyme YgiQ (UPF0313 family)